MTVSQINHLLEGADEQQHKTPNRAGMTEDVDDLYSKIESAKQRLDEIHTAPDVHEAGPNGVTSLSASDAGEERRPPLHRKMSLAEQGRLDTVTRFVSHLLIR